MKDDEVDVGFGSVRIDSLLLFACCHFVIWSLLRQWLVNVHWIRTVFVTVQFFLCFACCYWSTFFSRFFLQIICFASSCKLFRCSLLLVKLFFRFFLRWYYITLFYLAIHLSLCNTIHCCVLIDIYLLLWLWHPFVEILLRDPSYTRSSIFYRSSYYIHFVSFYSFNSTIHRPKQQLVLLISPPPIVLRRIYSIQFNLHKTLVLAWKKSTTTITITSMVLRPI